MSLKRGAAASVPPVTADDSDLEDLLQSNTNGKNQNEDLKDDLDRTPLNLDHLSKGNLDVPRRSTGSFGVCSYCNAYCQYMCFVYPRCCALVSVLTVAFIMFIALEAMLNPTETFGVIKNDYSNIRSEYDLKLGSIDHWCLKGDNDSCRCEDPLVPNSRIEFRTWNEAHKENKKKVQAFQGSDLLDVAFLGESIVEEMDGHWMGRQQGEELKSISQVFKQQFKRDNSGMEGVSLGIAGDTSPNVLWRLLHGEMPQDFNPRVWWLVLGMNDLGRMQCSEEVVILGILRVIEEIHKQKPDAEIVINSMLPMADLRGGMMPLPIDYQDAFRSKFKGRGAMLSSNANPTLFSRPADAVIASGKPKVTYQRPPTTTKVLSARNKGKFRGSLPPGIMGPPPGTMGPPLGTSAGKTTVVTTANSKPVSSSTVKPVTKDSNPGKARQLKKADSDESVDPKEKKKEIKAEKKFIKKLKKDPVNPKLNLDLTKIRVRDPKRLFLARNRLPIWTSINAINKQLRNFAEKQDDKISFFDATDIFSERTEGNKYILKSDRISVRGHPTVEGFQAWEEAVAKQLKKMFDKDDKLFSEEVAAADASVSAAAVLKASDGAAASSEDAKPKDDSDSDD